MLDSEVVIGIHRCVRINLRLRELASRDLVSEEDIQLFVRPALDLGDAEVGPDEDAQPRATPEETGLALPIPLGRVYRVGLQDLRHDVGELVRGPG